MWVQQVGSGVRALTFARDGRTLYTIDTNSRLLAWDTSTRARGGVLVTESYYINAAHFFELATGFLVVDVMNGVHLVDPATGMSARVLPAQRAFGQRAHAVLPDGRTFFVHTNGRAIGCLELLTSIEVSLEVPNVEPSRGVTSLSVAPDGRLAFLSTLTTGGRVLFDITPDNQLMKREPFTVVSPFVVPQFAPDGRTVILLKLVSQPELTVWDIEQCAARAKPVEWAGGEVRIAFNPVLPLFAVPHTANTVAVRSLETGELVRELDFALGKQITSLAFAPDGLTCAVGGTNKRFAVFDVDV